MTRQLYIKYGYIKHLNKENYDFKVTKKKDT